MARRPGGVWRAVGASVQGVSHLRNGTPCQDSNQVLELENGILVAAVADGAGSAPESHLGANWAARAAVEGLAERLRQRVPDAADEWHALLRDGMEAARQAVMDLSADSFGLAPQDLATTLLLAVALPDRVAAAQVGDGAVVVRLADETLHAVTRPPVGEFINETTFLTSPNWAQKAQFVMRPAPVTGLVMFTDGLQMLALKMPQGVPHVPFFQPLLRFVAATDSQAQALSQLEGFLQSPRIRQRADDDLTLMLAVRDGK
ncbi:MAG TPA: PP2C family serine/threonine-protein phosphatase [Gemmataceae bacterium]|nr:PP2C family serine/threonine-protein phosphatase [Gemmataceae bacterium]